MNTSLQIGKVMGIPVRLHWTFLAIIVYVGVGFGYLSQPIFGIPYGFGAIEPVQVKLLYSFAFAILLFACVALHELGHSYVARVYGIGIRSITLYFFGGVSSMEDIPRNPKLEFEMAFAGPGVSGVIGLACILLYLQLSALLGANHPFTILVSTLGVLNLFLMVFNLLPAFPMDGGRVLRSWRATRMPYMTATSRAASIGKMFAILIWIFGLFYGGILLLVIAFFIYIGASEEERATTINICLEGIKAKNIMSADVHTVPPEMTRLHTTLPDVISSRLDFVDDGPFCQIIVRNKFKLEKDAFIRNQRLKDALNASREKDLSKLPEIPITLLPEMRGKELRRGLIDL